MKKILFFIFVLLLQYNGFSIPIETPDRDTQNVFVINSPYGWGYRTFPGKNGLIGVLWPAGTSFNLTDTAVFVFLQDENSPLPEVANNINLFTEKCEKAKFKFNTNNNNDPTQSISEQYFSGRCGRTMILLKAVIKNYTIIMMFASAKYITKKQLADVKQMLESYKQEIKEHIADQETFAETNEDES